VKACETLPEGCLLVFNTGVIEFPALTQYSSFMDLSVVGTGFR